MPMTHASVDVVEVRRTSAKERFAMRTIETGDAPTHTGPVPQAVEVDGWVFVSALFGTDPKTGQLPDGAVAEAEQLFANLGAILRAAGGDVDDVVRVGIFTTHLQRDRPAFNEVWKRVFGDHRPARSAVEVAAFGRPTESPRFMIEATARIRGGQSGMGAS
jgi:2-iminobutanoate/2-iminopropanoate deaminase